MNKEQMMNKEQELRSIIGGIQLKFNYIKNCIAYYRADSNLLSKYTEIKINLKDISESMELEKDLVLIFNAPIDFKESKDCCIIAYKR